ncbi:ABC transporter substrate-binding protein [Muricoccus radiodurans]|uniref:ABC transporter substrate-binding protein n=1 Tax=Muricoccus radiodurans TaxID=2231721 RepID=UPI003CEAC7FA
MLRVVVGLAWIALVPALAGAQSLTMAVGTPITSLDPHFHNQAPNNAMADVVFDSLVRTDERVRLIPGLAESWRPLEDGVWEFKLRPGVTFHNGQPFTADDVAFTLARVPQVLNSPGSFSGYTRPIQRVEVVDSLTVRMHMGGPYPMLPTDIANIRVLNRATHANATTEDFNAGRAAIGSGPYRLRAYRNGDRAEVERNDAWYGPRQPWQNVTIRFVASDPARTAALLAGDVDFIDQVPTGDLERLRRDPRVHLSEVVGLRIIFLALDRSRAGATPFVTDNDGRPITSNPLNDRRVREALSLSIDRGSITERVMEAAAVPSGQFLPEGAFGHVPGLAAPSANLVHARALLAEAGFPQGFRITLHGPNDRYVNDARIIQAIGQMWTRAGIRTTVEALPWAAYIPRASRQDFSVFLWGWGSVSGEASNPLRALTATFDPARGWGASNRGRFSHPEHDRLLAEGLRTLDDGRREALLQAATRVAMEEVGIIPLHIQKNAWAMRRGLTHVARVDEISRPQDIAPAR